MRNARINTRIISARITHFRICCVLGHTLQLADALKLVFLCKINRTCSIMACWRLNSHHRLCLLIAHLSVYGGPTIPAYAPPRARPCETP